MRRELGLYGAANAPRKFDVWRHENQFCDFVMQVKVTASCEPYGLLSFALDFA